MGNYHIVFILESFQSLPDSLSGTAVIVAGERPRLDAPLNQNLRAVSREEKSGVQGLLQEIKRKIPLRVQGPK